MASVENIPVSMDLDAAYYNAVDLLKELIAIPSVSRDEERAADLLERYLRAALPGQTVFRKYNNCWVIAPGYDSACPTVLLNSHIDTVRPAESWTRDPFTPSEEGGERIYGLGSNDAGASLVSLLQCYLLLQGRSRSYNLIFLASAEEEVSGRYGIESVLPELPHIDFALVGEPTGMAVAVAERGLVVLDGVAIGKSGHAARNEGVNAIYEALPAIGKLREYRFQRLSETLGEVKVSVTQVQAGTAHNVVPDRCSFVVDVRTTDVYTNQEVVEQLQSLVAPVQLTPRSVRLQSSGIDCDHPFVRRAVCLGRKCFGSPTLSDQALLSCPSLKMGPGDSSRSHTADEFICRSEIREAIALYVHLLDGLSVPRNY